MATVNKYTLDRMERTLFYRVNQAQVPVRLPFDLVTIDGDDQYYEPHDGSWVDDKGQRQRGSAAGVVYLARNQALPDTRSNVAGQQAVWEYYGI